MIAAVINTVAHVKVGDALVVGALELVHLFTAETKISVLKSEIN